MILRQNMTILRRTGLDKLISVPNGVRNESVCFNSIYKVIPFLSKPPLGILNI